MQGSLKKTIPFVFACPPRISIRGFVLPVATGFYLRDETFFRQPESRFVFWARYFIRLSGCFCAEVL